MDSLPRIALNTSQAYPSAMINGVHALIYSKDADRTRAFFRDTLGLHTVDAGHGWLLFRLPPAELGIHPTENEPSHQLYLMCDDVHRTIAELHDKGVACNPVNDTGWGLLTSFEVPGGGTMGLYQPKHATALAELSR